VVRAGTSSTEGDPRTSLMISWISQVWMKHPTFVACQPTLGGVPLSPSEGIEAHTNRDCLGTCRQLGGHPQNREEPGGRQGAVDPDSEVHSVVCLSLADS
jgi:hypothetical protein